MRWIGRAANLLVDLIIKTVSWIFHAALFLFALVTVPLAFKTFWSWIDWSHLGSLPSLAGMAAIGFFGFMTLLAVGEFLDPFDISSLKPQSGGGKMRTANRDDLRGGGLFGGRR
jgi:hypothetical protein